MILAPLLTMPLPLHADIGQVLAPKSAADVPAPVPGAPLSQAYVEAIGRMAYLWAWPMVNMHNRQQTFAKVPYPGPAGRGTARGSCERTRDALGLCLAGTTFRDLPKPGRGVRTWCTVRASWIWARSPP